MKNEKQGRNLPAYVDTRCRRHIELPAKRHRLQTQQTPGTHWETLSLRERDKDREDSVSAFPDVQKSGAEVQSESQLPVLGEV